MANELLESRLEEQFDVVFGVVFCERVEDMVFRVPFSDVDLDCVGSVKEDRDFVIGALD